MNKDNLNILNKYYVKRNQNKIKELDIKNEKCEKKIKDTQQSIEKNEHILEKLKEENKDYKIKYERLKQIFYERGLVITIVNKGYSVKEWDNLYFKKRSNLLAIYLKDNEEVKIFNKEITLVLEELLQGKNHSLVATRVDEKSIKVKLHIR
ncbi:hypothetical protein [Clostridium lundense]|uniref:hypothetical protein n=1 Tax=Clostridium lundense TaxID=319475 RepID=UPI000685F2DF|nr:hypothetical protein [Clostridium lundense]